MDVAVLGATLVTGVDGTTLGLARAWAERDCLLVFLRHFACPSCSALAAELAPRVPELGALDVGVWIVGAGSPEAAAAFRTRLRLDDPRVELVVSPDLAAYRAAELVRSRRATYGPRSLWAALCLYALGHGAKRRPDDGDVTQQGGVAFVLRGGVLAWHHANRDLGDHLSLNDIVDRALARAAARSGALV
ncbi:MAG: hypothetical protein IT373_05320 [Polyangiaceae bacterium]|nr:hypothetical protein [Polyangiaceae bacterium]